VARAEQPLAVAGPNVLVEAERLAEGGDGVGRGILPEQLLRDVVNYREYGFEFDYLQIGLRA
jgi:hypothetical protein